MNITVYRITPANVTGLENKNTGDSIGDINFFLMRKNMTMECAADPNGWGCFLDGNNVYVSRQPHAEASVVTHCSPPRAAGLHSLDRASSSLKWMGYGGLTKNATRL